MCFRTSTTRTSLRPLPTPLMLQRATTPMPTPLEPRAGFCAIAVIAQASQPALPRKMGRLDTSFSAAISRSMGLKVPWMTSKFQPILRAAALSMQNYQENNKSGITWDDSCG